MFIYFLMSKFSLSSFNVSLNLELSYIITFPPFYHVIIFHLDIIK